MTDTAAIQANAVQRAAAMLETLIVYLPARVSGLREQHPSSPG